MAETVEDAKNRLEETTTLYHVQDAGVTFTKPKNVLTPPEI